MSLSSDPNLSQPSPEYIKGLFDDLARRYDLFNAFASLGMDKGWRAEALKDVSTGMRVLDLGCGTGDLVIEAAQKIGPTGEVRGIDFSPNMIQAANARLAKLGTLAGARVSFAVQDARQLPVTDTAIYDRVVSGFVLRNIYQHIDEILHGVHRCLKPGGGLSFVDIARPSNRLMYRLSKFYWNTVVALYGKLIFGGKYPATYLAASADRFPAPLEFVERLSRAGFSEARSRSFMGGMVVLYTATKH